MTTPTLDTLRDLQRRVAAASGPDRKLDAEAGERNVFLSLLREELRLVEARAAAIRRLLRTYEDAPAQRATTRAPSQQTLEILAGVEAIFAQDRSPKATREILRKLNEAGIYLTGKSQINSLSAVLSNSAQFHNCGRSAGWALVEVSRAETAKAEG